MSPRDEAVVGDGWALTERLFRTIFDNSDFTRRNANFKVAGGHGPGFLLKQGVDEERRAMLAHEARVYRLLGAAQGGVRFQTYLPRLHLLLGKRCTDKRNTQISRNETLDVYD